MKLNPALRMLPVAAYSAVVLFGFQPMVEDCPPCVEKMFLEPDVRHGSTSDVRGA